MKYLFAALMLLSSYTLPAQHRKILPTDGFTITGDVKREKIYHIADLMKCKQDTLGDVMVRNHKGDTKDTLKGLKGILLRDILDSVEVVAEKPKEYSEFCVLLIASDGYKNVYSWNEIFNTEVGSHVYIITEMDGKPIAEFDQRILVLSLSDINSGRRHLKCLSKIVFKKIE